MDDARYRLKGASIIHEVIDGEAVIANLDDGLYYSVDGPIGVTIWESLVAGVPAGRIVATLATSYQGAEVGEGVAGFVASLLKEGLIAPVPGESEDGEVGELPGSSLADLPPKFSAPELSKYTDMQELLLLDPIHEVDEAGWPAAQKE